LKKKIIKFETLLRSWNSEEGGTQVWLSRVT